MNPPGANDAQQQQPPQQQQQPLMQHLGPDQQDYADYQSQAAGRSNNHPPATLQGYEVVPTDEGVDVDPSKWKSLITIMNTYVKKAAEIRVGMRNQMEIDLNSLVID